MLLTCQEVEGSMAAGIVQLHPLRGSRTPGSAIFSVLALVLLLVASCHERVITTSCDLRFEVGRRGGHGPPWCLLSGNQRSPKSPGQTSPFVSLA